MCTCTCTNYFVGDVCDVVEKSYPDHDSIEFWRSIEESSDFRTRCHKKVRVHTVFLFRHWPNSEMFNLTVAIYKKNWNWVRALQHLVLYWFWQWCMRIRSIVFFFLKTSPSDTLSICVVVLQENGAEVPGGVSRWAGITEHSHNELPENASPHWGNRCLF